MGIGEENVLNNHDCIGIISITLFIVQKIPNTVIYLFIAKYNSYNVDVFCRHPEDLPPVAFHLSNKTSAG